MRLGVFGGTFDPVHLGHLVAAEEATELLALDEMLFVPAGQPWFKAAEPVMDAAHRLNMVRLAIESNPRFRVCDVEVARPGPSYTVDTLEHLRENAQPGTEIFLVLGLDALSEMHRWHCPARVFELATVVGVARPGAAFDPALLSDIFPSAAERVIMLDITLVGVGASELRRRAAAGRSLRYLLPDSVEAYIREHGLYKRGEHDYRRGTSRGDS